MKMVIEILFLFFLLTSLLFAQDKNYWANAPVGSNKIYTIIFTDKYKGCAITIEKQAFITKDSGNNWSFVANSNNDLDTYKIFWKADVFFSVMQSTDGGENWKLYTGKDQDHFCKVYLKDPNVDYKTASEFLSKVSSNIFDKLADGHIGDLINHPKQCTEYYCNESEGWALGWCIKNFNMKE